MTTVSWGLAANIQAHKKLFSLTLHHIDLFQLCHEFILPEMVIITSVVDNFPIEIPFLKNAQHIKNHTYYRLLIIRCGLSDADSI